MPSRATSHETTSPEHELPRVAVSACLLGDAVRYDGTDKRDEAVLALLAGGHAVVRVCPELECGLGVPRPPMRLVGEPAAPRAVVITTGEDLTETLTSFARARVAALLASGVDGFVLKSRSPSCGLGSAPVHDSRGVERARAHGLFAAAIAAIAPELPASDERELADGRARALFAARVLEHHARRVASVERSEESAPEAEGGGNEVRSGRPPPTITSPRDRGACPPDP